MVRSNAAKRRPNPKTPSMNGKILHFDANSREGVISGDDGNRYRFIGPDWHDSSTPMSGLTVDFVADGDRARDVYRVTSSSGTYPKSKIAAALFAFFLGLFGAHKFYLGYTTPGVILLVATIAGIALVFVLVGLAVLFAIGVVTLIEAILYIAKSDEEFHETYVVNKREWF